MRKKGLDNKEGWRRRFGEQWLNEREEQGLEREERGLDAREEEGLEEKFARLILPLRFSLSFNFLIFLLYILKYVCNEEPTYIQILHTDLSLESFCQKASPLHMENPYVNLFPITK